MVMVWLVALVVALFVSSAGGNIADCSSCCRCSTPVVDWHYDVVVYRATPAGIAAALAAAATASHPPQRTRKQQSSSSNAGVKVLLLEPTGHIGGMATEGGIGLRDALNDDLRSNPKSSQYRWGQLNAQHYLGLNNSSSNKNSSAVLWQPDHWVGERSFWKLLNDTNVEVCLHTDLVEGSSGVRIEKGPSASSRRIEAVQLTTTTNHGESRDCWVYAKYFIDASYEGDLMQASGVSFTSGREASDTYQESWAGVTNHSESQFPLPIDPFDRDGRLLRYIQYAGPNPIKHLGAADRHVMAFSYRVCLTRDSNRIPISAPMNYNATDFELARRLVLTERKHNRSLSQPWLYLDYMGYDQIRSATMKYDACCGFSPVGIDATGLAVGYATASRARRVRIAEAHRYYVQGLLWFWQNDLSVPEHVRHDHAQYGLCPKAWPDNGHFPRQLYVREAARMVGNRVFTQQDRQKQKTCQPDSIAVGSWGFDIHEMQRVALYTGSRWITYNEGSTGYRQGDHFPFDIPFWILLPKRSEMTNLLVPNCPSVSHVAFAAIRVEPTLWQLGLAAGTAAALLVNSQNGTTPLHDIDIGLLQQELMKQGNPIHWPLNKTCCGIPRPFRTNVVNSY